VNQYHQLVKDYVQATSSHRPLFICGDAFTVLRELPDEVFDFCMTSPPYWGQREYTIHSIGQEADLAAYLHQLLAVFCEIKRILKPTGSFWLNLGDTYRQKGLMGIPWRVVAN
jgi:site-specific DNA-methyltransferase (adenine-specific)